MDKWIKESLDQIHAPKSLVDDTIRKMHEVQNGGTRNKNTKVINWKPAAGIVTALAACVVLVLFGKNMLGAGIDNATKQDETHNVADLPGGNDVLNGDNAGKQDEFQFEAVKGITEWKETEALLEESGDDIQELTSDYVIYETTYECNGEGYQLEILLEDGTLSKHGNMVIAKGQFMAQISSGDEKIEETVLAIESTSQFSDGGTGLTIEDTDGQVKFLLETACNSDGTKTEVWYTIDVSGKISEMNM